MGLARFYHPSHGRSALRFGHTLDEALRPRRRPLALLTVLVLRGPRPWRAATRPSAWPSSPTPGRSSPTSRDWPVSSRPWCGVWVASPGEGGAVHPAARCPRRPHAPVHVRRAPGHGRSSSRPGRGVLRIAWSGHGPRGFRCRVGRRGGRALRRGARPAARRRRSADTAGPVRAPDGHRPRPNLGPGSRRPA